MAQQFHSRLKVSNQYLFCFIKTCVRCCGDAFMLKVSVVGGELYVVIGCKWFGADEVK